MIDERIGDDGLTPGDREMLEQLRQRLVMKHEQITSWRLAEDAKPQQLQRIMYNDIRTS